MYTPAKFKQTQWEEICRFIQANPLATLIANTENGLEATHIPLLWKENTSEFGCLYGHFAKSNSIWKKSIPEQEWLIIGAVLDN